MSGGRIGLVFVVNDDDDVDGMQDAGVAVLRAFNYVAEESDNQMAFDVVVSVSRLQMFTPNLSHIIVY